MKTVNKSLAYPLESVYTETMYKGICVMCQTDFESAWKHTVTCSKECRIKKDKKISSKTLYGVNIATGTTGAIAEMEVATDLMKKGYSVFRALSPSCYCDLIAVKENETLHVEVRTGILTYGNSRMFFSKEVKGSANCFGIFAPSLDKVIYYELDTITVKEI